MVKRPQELPHTMNPAPAARLNPPNLTQAPPIESKTPQTTSFKIHTSLLFDSKTKTFERDLTITVNSSTGLISHVARRSTTAILSPQESAPPNLDLRGKLVLPGFVDAHTHVFLHPYTETPSYAQEISESSVERIVRATNNCRAALRAGYTTYRDLGTEGVRNADTGLRDAINRGLTPGPRLFVATEPLASSGGYEVRVENTVFGDVGVPRLSDPCDGVEGCAVGVRRRIGAGADVIKFYSEYRRRSLRWPEKTWKGACGILHPPLTNDLFTGGRSPNSLLFSQEEMNSIVVEATRAGAPVAAHCSSGKSVVMAANAGVTTVEHGYQTSEEAVQAMKKNNTIFVPTLSVMEAEAPNYGDDLFPSILKHTKRAWEVGVRLACGGDTGAVAHGDNAREMELMVQAGIPIVDVLRACTLGGWEACGADLCGMRFGWLGEGWRADLVALEGYLDEESFEKVIRNVKFVMKDGMSMVVDGRVVELGE